MGFEVVYDYASGKQDWLAAGLPIEGRGADVPRAGTVARTDVPTCRLDERLGEVADRARSARWEAAVVVNEDRVVLGLLRKDELAGDPSRPIEEAMRPGPSTFRPHVHIVEMARYMAEHDLVSCPITTGQGVLIGLLRRDDAVAAALDFQRRHAEEHHEHA
jgi:Mg/Co/Ni transporter MgtE